MDRVIHNLSRTLGIPRKQTVNESDWSQIGSVIEIWEELTTHRVNVAKKLRWLNDPAALDRIRKEKLRSIIK